MEQQGPGHKNRAPSQAGTPDAPNPGAVAKDQRPKTKTVPSREELVGN